MEYIKKKELIIGEIYYVSTNNFWMIGLVTKSNNGDNSYDSFRGNATYISKDEDFNKDKSWCYEAIGRTYRLASSEEKHWLNECIKLDKFITFEEAMKTFIPEYVECIEETDYNFYGKLGTVYKVQNWNYSTNDCMLEGTTSGSTYRKRFKPSTKETYDAQFVVKESEFVLPEKWYIQRNSENFEVLNEWENHKRGSHVAFNKDNGCSMFSDKDYSFTKSHNILGYTEITFEQFKKYVLKEETVIEFGNKVDKEIIEQPVIENKTELEIWLENTKSLNLSLEDLEKYIGSGQTCNYYNIYTKLEGNYSKGRAKILFDKWNNKIIEPLPQFKVIETIETITKVENNEGNQFFIGDVVKSSNGVIQIIESFNYNKSKTNIIAFTNKQSILGNGIGIDKIEHYIEPKIEVEESLLDKAKRLYPIGTKFRNAYNNDNCIIKEGEFFEGNNNNIYHSIEKNIQKYEKGLSGCVYYGDKWSEIIKYPHDFKIGDKIKLRGYITAILEITKIEGNVLFFKHENGYESAHTRVLAKNAIKVN